MRDSFRGNSRPIDPSVLVGVWRRESLTISEREAFEDSVVYWLHAGDYFADMRWPLEQSRPDVPLSAFAGRAHWSTPQMRFCHDIDFSRAHPEDVASLTMLGGKLLERGQATVAGEAIDFQEVWAPCSPRGDSIRVDVARMETNTESGANADIGYLVRVDNFAIAMQEVDAQFSAMCWHQKDEDSSWHTLNSIGAAADLNLLLQEVIAGSPRSGWQPLIQVASK